MHFGLQILTYTSVNFLRKGSIGTTHECCEWHCVGENAPQTNRNPARHTTTGILWRHRDMPAYPTGTCKQVLPFIGKLNVRPVTTGQNMNILVDNDDMSDRCLFSSDILSTDANRWCTHRSIGDQKYYLRQRIHYSIFFVWYKVVFKQLPIHIYYGLHCWLMSSRRQYAHMEIMGQ